MAPAPGHISWNLRVTDVRMVTVSPLNMMQPHVQRSRLSAPFQSFESSKDCLQKIISFPIEHEGLPPIAPESRIAVPRTMDLKSSAILDTLHFFVLVRIHAHKVITLLRPHLRYIVDKEYQSIHLSSG